jgi:hypothetical protein
MTKDLTKYADQYVTTAQVAEILGVVTDPVNRLLIGKKLKGVKLGYSWLVYIPSIAKYQQTKSKRGRPSSGSPKIQETNDGQG